MPRVSLTLPILVLTLVTGTAVADELIKLGNEQQINTYTPSNQGLPAIALDPDGKAVIVFEGQENVGDDFWAIYGQRYDAEGAPVGGEFQVSTFTLDLQVNPDVDSADDGSFVVVWQSESQGVNEGFDIFGQRYDSDGMRAGGEFQVNEFTMGDQDEPAIAVQDDGEFLVVWSSEDQDGSDKGVFARRFDEFGTPQGIELQVNIVTTSDQNQPAVTRYGSGFLVAWEDLGLDGSDEGIVLQELNQNAGFVGTQEVINTFTIGAQENPQLAANPDGSFAVVWESSGQDGDFEGVYGQVFDAGGMPSGGEFRINSYTTGNQDEPTVAADGRGGFVAVWESDDQAFIGSDEDIIARRFGSGGQLLGPEFVINTEQNDEQDAPAIAGFGGRFWSAWRSVGDQDGEAAGAFGQRLEVAIFVDGFESGDTSAWSGSF